MKRIALANHEMECGSGYWRAALPFRWCEKPCRESGVELVIPDRWVDVDGFDAILFYRMLGSQWSPLPWKHFAERKAFVHWDMDDNFRAVPEWSVAKKSFNGADLLGLEICLGWAKTISVSTPRLSDSLGGGSRTRVLPNLIDLSDFRTQLRASDRVRIMWAGSSTHTKDLEIIVPALEAARDAYGNSVEIIFVGDCPDFILKNPRIDPTFMHWAPVDQYPRMLSLLNPTIGLAPLADDPESAAFNQCKSPIKWMEYAAAGAVTIASNAPPYSDVIESGVTGTLCGSDPEEWKDALLRACDESVNRASLGFRHPDWPVALAEVRRNHSWHSETCRNLWVNHFLEMVK